MAGVNVDHVDLVAGAVFGLGGVGDLLAVCRPDRRLLGDFFGGGEVYNLAGLGRDEEDVPEFVAVVVGRIGDPGAVGRPGGLDLALRADGKLRRPTAGGRDEPEIIAAADVADKGDLFAVGRPGGAPSFAGHVELLDSEVLHVLEVAALELDGGGEGRLGETGEDGERD